MPSLYIPIDINKPTHPAIEEESHSDNKFEIYYFHPSDINILFIVYYIGR